MAQQQQQQEQQLEGIHKYKISPPRFTGEYNTFEEWKYKMTAYLGLQDPACNRLLRQSEQSVGQVTNDQLENAAPSQQVAEQWMQLSNNLHYLLVSTRDGPASTICRQNTQGNGFETWRLIHATYSIPRGTRSIGYLTRLLKPQLDEQKFEESFTTWEFQLSKYEQDNNTLLPDAVKIAVLLNETKGPLQQHLQPQAGNITTYAQIRPMVTEYYRATATFTRLQALTSGSNNQGPAPINIKATWHNKGKGKRGKHKGKGRYNKGKGCGSYGNNYNYKRGNRQAQSTIGWTRKSFQRTTRIWQRKRIQQQRKRKRISQQSTRRKRSKRKACAKYLLQMWTARTHGQTRQSGDLQLRHWQLRHQ